MQCRTYLYDEGYGCGEREIHVSGMTVNEVIELLSTLAQGGYGEEILFDPMEDPVEDIEIVESDRYGHMVRIR